MFYFNCFVALNSVVGLLLSLVVLGCGVLAELCFLWLMLVAGGFWFITLGVWLLSVVLLCVG